MKKEVLLLLIISIFIIAGCQVPVGQDIERGVSSTERPISVTKTADKCEKYNKFGNQAQYACAQDKNCGFLNGKCLPKCGDGTLLGQCSKNQPEYCEDNKDYGIGLKDNCFDCGCPNEGRCTAHGNCEFPQEGFNISVTTDKDVYFTGESIKIASESRSIVPSDTVDVVNSIPNFYKKDEAKIVSSLGGPYVKKPVKRNDFDGYIVILKDPSVIDEWQRLNSIRAKRTGDYDINKELKTYAGKIKNSQDSVLELTGGNSVTGNQVRDGSLVVKARYSSVLNGMWIGGSKENIDKIRKDSRVKSVTPSYLFYAVAFNGVSEINAENVVTRDTGTSLTGKGIKVAVIDTGIDYTHKDFGSCTRSQILTNTCPKIIDAYDFVQDDKDVLDVIGHGTHVAGIIAGNGDIKGVAPEASLMIYTVCERRGCSQGDILEAIERAIDPNKDFQYDDRADVISMSLGGSTSTPPEEDPFTFSINSAVSAGSVVVIAAGNSGPDKGTIESPGLITKAITVGASCLPEQVWSNVDCKTEYPYIALFSSRGPSFANDKPDVVAPGVDICAAKSEVTAMGNNLKTCYDEGHILLSGTSMATPHVSGAVALIREAYPDWDYRMVKNALKNSAKTLGYPRYIQGSGLIDVKSALEFNRNINVEVTKLSGGQYTELTEE